MLPLPQVEAKSEGVEQSKEEKAQLKLQKVRDQVPKDLKASVVAGDTIGTCLVRSLPASGVYIPQGEGGATIPRRQRPDRNSEVATQTITKALCGPLPITHRTISVSLAPLKVEKQEFYHTLLLVLLESHPGEEADISWKDLFGLTSVLTRVCV